MLICDALTCFTWRRTLFKGLGFCLLEGSLLVVTGGTPAIKKTLLNVIAGKRMPQSGAVRFEAKPVRYNAEFTRLMLHMEAGNDLKMRLTVEENIRHLSSQDGSDLTRAAMHYFKLTAYARVTCNTLPAHLQKRVSLTRLLTMPCPFWLLYEPAAGLDDEGAGLLYALISQRCNQNGIVIMTADHADCIAPCLPLNLDDFR